MATHRRSQRKVQRSPITHRDRSPYLAPTRTEDEKTKARVFDVDCDLSACHGKIKAVTGRKGRGSKERYVR